MIGKLLGKRRRRKGAPPGSSKWCRNFFLNCAEPTGLVRCDRTLTEDEYEEIRARWKHLHAAPGDAR